MTIEVVESVCIKCDLCGRLGPTVLRHDGDPGDSRARAPLQKWVQFDESDACPICVHELTAMVCIARLKERLGIHD